MVTSSMSAESFTSLRQFEQTHPFTVYRTRQLHITVIDTHGIVAAAAVVVVVVVEVVVVMMVVVVVNSTPSNSLSPDTFDHDTQ